MKIKKVYATEPWKIGIIEEEQDIVIENSNEVIVQNLFSHISAGTEMACISGIESWFTLPNTPGYTAVGKVLEKGEGVTRVDIGDIVYTFGPHTSHFKIDVTDRFHGVCVKVPDGLAPDIAAFTHMGGIAISSLRASNIQLGDIVAVSGLGAIGNLAAQFAQLQGANVIATDINSSRVKIAKLSGIGHAIDTTHTSFSDALKKLTGKEKVDCWIDATGQSAVVEESLNYIETNGEMILLGSPRAEFRTNLTKTLQKIHLLEAIHMKSALEFTFPTHQNDFNKHSIERNSEIIMQLMKKDVLKIKPIYSHKLKPEDAATAYFGLRDNPDEYIGVVFDWSV